ncbi:MAG: tetratricopeptide repeat protein [Candidatus Obscuribacter sp.]|nr:tetratricopeptide repeat protein [Candidatus Obscuribacter sp.]
MSIHKARALLLYEQRNYQNAISEFRQALKEDPEDGQAHRLLAMSLSLEGQHKEAIREIKYLLGKYPNDEDVLHVAGLIHFNNKRDGDAEKFIKASLAIFPDHADGHLILSYIAERREKWKQMRDHAQAALNLEPEHVAALIALARAKSELSDQKGARLALESALAIEPNDAQAHAHLGRLLLDLGDRTGAREHLRESLRLDPTCSDALEGFIESLRAKNIFYFWFISFVWAMTRGPARYIAYLRLGHPILLALVILFWLFVWTVRELATLSLRFDKDVRHYLPPDFKTRNTRNLLVISCIFGLFIGMGAYGDYQKATQIKSLKLLTTARDQSKAKEVEAELFDKAYKEFVSSSYSFIFDLDELNAIYDFELKQRPQNKYRLALIGLWLGMGSRGRVVKGDEVVYFRQALTLANEIGDRNLSAYIQAQIAYSQGKTDKQPGQPKWLSAKQANLD